MSCAEQSLRNLGLETIDLLQLHVWHDEWLEQGDWLETVEALKREGKIRSSASRSTTTSRTPRCARHSGSVDTVQVIYNVFDQRPEDELFPACREHGVGVLARVPFDEGGLTGHDHARDGRSRRATSAHDYFPGDRKRRSPSACRRSSTTSASPVEAIAETALRFSLSTRRGLDVIPGMRSIRNVERNGAAPTGAAAAPSSSSDLRAHGWVRDFYSRSAGLGAARSTRSTRALPGRRRRRRRRPRRVRRRLAYLAWLGVDAVWLSPFYRSPMADFGYDVADHCDVDPLFGTLEDLDAWPPRRAGSGCG